MALREEELAARKGHAHLGEVARALDELGDAVATEHIVPRHSLMRYTASEIAEYVDRVIPPRFRSRVRLFP